MYNDPVMTLWPIKDNDVAHMELIPRPAVPDNKNVIDLKNRFHTAA
jgi:hypothetical protein